MSGNAEPPKLDRRVRRTRDRLGDALVALMHEKPFDAISVQDVLDRASVSRSTFYAHFSDKDDLLLGDADEMFRHLASRVLREQADPPRLAPVRELLAHVGSMGTFREKLEESGRMQDVLDLARAHFAHVIAQQLARPDVAPGLAPGQRAAAAHALAGSLMALMDWWLGAASRGTPQEMDDLFHRLAREGLGGR